MKWEQGCVLGCRYDAESRRLPSMKTFVGRICEDRNVFDDRYKTLPFAMACLPRVVQQTDSQGCLRFCTFRGRPLAFEGAFKITDASSRSFSFVHLFRLESSSSATAKGILPRIKVLSVLRFQMTFRPDRRRSGRRGGLARAFLHPQPTSKSPKVRRREE